jgi:hypothetical protein
MRGFTVFGFVLVALTLLGAGSLAASAQSWNRDAGSKMRFDYGRARSGRPVYSYRSPRGSAPVIVRAAPAPASETRVAEAPTTRRSFSQEPTVTESEPTRARSYSNYFAPRGSHRGHDHGLRADSKMLGNYGR